MSGPTSIKNLMDTIIKKNTISDAHAESLWLEVRARLEAIEATETIEEVESFNGRVLDTHPRDIVTDAIAYVLTGAPFWPNSYPGSPFVYKLLKACFARGYIDTDRTTGDCPSLRFFVDSFDGVEQIRREVVPASLYDQAQAELAELRRQVAERDVDTDTKLAADRWNALMSSERMRVLGHAGFRPQEDAERNKAHLAGHRHIGIDFWSHHDADDGAKQTAVEMITAYADQIIENNRAPAGAE